MKVIITGGTGMIGRALAHLLEDQGHEIVLLSRSGGRPDGVPSTARIVQWDGQTGEGWSDELRDTDAVVNLAGENIGNRRWSRQHKQRLLDSRVNAGRAFVNAVERSGSAPSRLIQASGTNYYGHRDDAYLNESEPPGDDFLSDVCIQWEQSTAPLEELGTRRALIRSGVVFHATEGALPRLVRPFRFFVGGRLASGKQGFSWIHIDDHVRALDFLLRHPEITGPVNFTAPEPVTNRELAQAIGRVLRRPTLFPVPGFALRLVVGEFAIHLINGQFVVPERLLSEGFEFRFPNVEPALRDVLG